MNQIIRPRVRILHLVYQLGCGGMENGIVNLANHMDTERFHVGVCVFVGNGAYEKRIDTSRTPLFFMNKPEGNDPLLPFKLIRLFRHWKPHILHTHAWGTLVEGILAGKLAKVPIIVHGEHGTMETRYRNILVQRIFWKFTDRILSVSKMHKKKLIQTIGAGYNITVIPNGVDTERFHPTIDKTSVRKQLGWPTDAVCLISVGRLVPVKDHDTLIRAFAKLKQNVSQPIRLYLVGDGPLDDELRQLAGTLGLRKEVKFLGQRDDVPRLLQAADIFVLPSKSEGMSNTLLEAMSTRLCIVATKVGGNLELVSHGKTGVLVPPNDVEPLASMLEWLIEDTETRTKLGLAARHFVQDHYSLGTMMKNYSRLYIELLEIKKLKKC